MTTTIPRIETCPPEDYAELPYGARNEIVDAVNGLLEANGNVSLIKDTDARRVTYDKNTNMLFIAVPGVVVIVYLVDENILRFNANLYNPSKGPKFFDIALSDNTQKVLQNIAEYYDTYKISTHEILHGTIHYDKITNNYQTTIIVYGDHDYMSASDYLVVQESLNNGEIIDEKKHWSIHAALDKHCPCEDSYCYDREEEYCDECGRSIGYVDTGKVNDKGVPLYEKAVMFHTTPWTD